MMPIPAYRHLRHIFFATSLLLSQTRNLWAQQLGRGSDDGIDPWRIAAALAVCVIVTIVAAFLLKSRLRGTGIFRPGHRPRRLQLVETLRIGTQNDICVVSFDGEELLLASSAQGIVLLHPLAARPGIVGR